MLTELVGNQAGTTLADRNGIVDIGLLSFSCLNDELAISFLVVVATIDTVSAMVRDHFHDTPFLVHYHGNLPQDQVTGSGDTEFC